ncbi:MAG: hypothetical protein GTN81_17760 [Proteobacteria bacterium]|nr:hypothetical protein [Pseudomonadota bacterium]
MTSQWSWSEKKIFFWQVVLLVTFYTFIFGIVIWIIRLIWLSWQLRDVFSGSIGISLVAMPLFLFLLAVYNYVFWGILLNRGQKKRGGKG